MVEKKTISIELVYGSTKIDLQVPKYVTKIRLQELLEMNAQELQLTFPKNWTLVLQDKKVVLMNDQLLANYPISDGDQFRIQEKQVED